MSAKPGGDGGNAVMELAKGRMLDVRTKSRWTIRIISSGSA
jgi:hypothetical protein